MVILVLVTEMIHYRDSVHNPKQHGSIEAVPRPGSKYRSYKHALLRQEMKKPVAIDPYGRRHEILNFGEIEDDNPLGPTGFLLVEKKRRNRSKPKSKHSRVSRKVKTNGGMRETWF